MFTTSKAEHSRPRIRAAMAVVLLTTFSGCGIENLPNPFEREQDAAAGASPADNAVAGTRDIEAPAVFETTEPGLWDGRPSLGGIWVAHPDVTDPERVIIRNRATGQSVTGALFKRERESPGPKLQVSSEAAAELGMLAGQPAELNVVALRRDRGTESRGGRHGPVIWRGRAAYVRRSRRRRPGRPGRFFGAIARAPGRERRQLRPRSGGLASGRVPTVPIRPLATLCRAGARRARARSCASGPRKPEHERPSRRWPGPQAEGHSFT